MAEDRGITSADMAEILLMLRKSLFIIVGIILSVTVVTFYFLDPFIGKISRDLLPEGARLIFLTPLEYWILKLKIALLFGVIASFPYILRTAGKALRERTDFLNNFSITRRSIFIYGISSALLFIAGVSYGYLLMLPLFLQFLYSNAVSAGVIASYSIYQFIMFIFLILVIFGLVFQMPLVMTLLVNYNLVQYKTLKEYRRHFYVGFFVVGAAVTSPDIFTQMMVAFPLILFYEISLIAVKIILRKKIKKEELFSEPIDSEEISSELA
jgi:sec-independent protein translocase protein TatC